MRISVHVDTPYKTSTMTVLGLKVRYDDLVSSVKGRISSIAMIPFPEQALLHSGKPLPDNAQLDECGLEDGTFLDFVVYASDEIFAEQLADLIVSSSDPDMSASQLGTLYFYKHGASASQALRILGCAWGEKFRDFLWRHPRFAMEKGCVTLTPSVPGTPSAAGSPSRARGVALPAGQNQAFVNLHAQLASDSAIEQTSLAMDHLCALIPDLLFFHVERVVRGGSAGTETAVASSVTAELLFVVRGLPTANLERTLPSLHCSTAAILQNELVGLVGVERVWQAGEAVRVLMDGAIAVDLLFAPAAWSFSEGEQRAAFEQARRAGASESSRKIRAAAEAEQKFRFLRGLPEPLKMTIRMLKWWRGKWQWSGSGGQPSDELLEYVAVWSCVESQPQDLYTAVMNAIAKLARFSELIALPHSDAGGFASKYFNGEELPGAAPLGWNDGEFRSFDATEMMSYAKATQESLFPA